MFGKVIAAADDTRDNWMFIHNLERDKVAETTELVKLVTRDVPGSKNFWVINMIGAYEGPKLEDYSSMGGLVGNCASSFG